jgi:hypothetical protein
MAEIGKLPPAYRIPPSRPGSETGQRNQAPQRKPENDDRQPDKRRQRKKDDGDASSHIDEYV